MRISRSSTGNAPSLRRTWTRISVALIATIVGLGLVALASTQYQRALFAQTTSDLQRQTAAVDDLERSMLEVNQMVIGVLYQSRPDQRAASRVDYVLARDQLDAAFEVADREVAGTPMAPRLTEAQSHWSAANEAVMAAEEKWEDGSVVAAFQAGEDPFARSVWAEVFDLTSDLTELGAQSVETLEEQVAAVDRVQLLVGPVIAAAIVVALGMGWMLGRRMQQRFLRPLVELRSAALAMRDTDIERIAEVPHASAELQDLATILNETSMSLRTSHNRLHAEANTDALSGLPNRRAFVGELHTMLDETDRGAVGVLFVDLDDFKVVNDSLGHASGDELLRVVGRRLRTSARGDEVVARLGGDEFAIAVRAPSAASLTSIAERTLSVIEHPVTIDDTIVAVRCSIGVARSPEGGGRDCADELLRNADFAMYMAKGQGKSRFELFAPSMHTEMLARMELKRDLSQAVDRDQLVLAYQPLIDLATQEVLGFEALIRWNHPERGLLTPGEFIGLAEDTGDIVHIGEWVLDEACATLASMHRHRPDSTRLRMSVNVSSPQLGGTDLLDAVDRTLERRGLTPDDLVIEVTEGVAMTNTGEAARTLTALRERGVHVALDDFGTGYSSLRWLNELPVDIVKIDRSFVAADGSESESMLETIVALGQRLGLQVVAEGIERPRELDRLLRLGADAGQGYLFAHPMAAAEALGFGLAAPAQQPVVARGA